MIGNELPRSMSELNAWANKLEIPLPDARVRFAQYAILLAFGRVSLLREMLIFKGGNALDFVWSPNRSTMDLDFSIESLGSPGSVNKVQFRGLLSAGLDAGRGVHGVVAKVQRWDQFPRRGDQKFSSV